MPLVHRHEKQDVVASARHPVSQFINISKANPMMKIELTDLECLQWEVTVDIVFVFASLKQ